MSRSSFSDSLDALYIPRRGSGINGTEGLEESARDVIELGLFERCVFYVSAEMAFTRGKFDFFFFFFRESRKSKTYVIFEGVCLALTLDSFGAKHLKME